MVGGTNSGPDAELRIRMLAARLHGTELPTDDLQAGVLPALEQLVEGGPRVGRRWHARIIPRLVAATALQRGLPFARGYGRGMPRVAIARISQETNVHCPVRAELDDFRRHHLLVGEEIRTACRRGQEVAGYIPRAELAGAIDAAGPDVEIVPTVSAWTLPGGPLSHQAFAALRRMLLDGLGAGPFDGVLIVLHGAMVVDGVDDPDLVLLADARAALRPGGALVVCLDSHARLTEARVAAADAIVAFRTNPHRDHARTGAEGMRLLLRLLGGLRPATAWRSLPMIFGGGTTIDVAPAMWPVRQALAHARRTPGVVTANLFMCHPWSDSPDLGWATHVVTDDDPALAARVAEELAKAAWSVRGHMPPAPKDAPDAIATVRRRWWLRKLGVACLVDTSDVVEIGRAHV